MLVEAPPDGVRDRVLALRAMPAFEPLDEDDLALLAEHARVRRFAPGAQILIEGQQLDRVHALMEGHVQVTRDGEMLADLRGTGHVGLISHLAEQRAPGAVAVSETQTLEIPAEVITIAAHERFDIARNSVRLIAAELLARRGQLPIAPGGDDEPPIGVHRPRNLTLVEKMISIRQVPAFANANFDAIAELAKHARDLRFQPGDTLWQIGDPAPWSIRIDYGRVACSNEKGERVVVGGGYTLGAMDGVAGARRAYSATALTEVIGMEIRSAVQLAVLEVHPTLARELRKNLARLLVMTGGQ